MKRMGLSLTLLCLAALASSAPAHAAYDPVGSGTAKLVLDKRFMSFLKANGIALAATAPARRKGRSLLLPVTGGNLDPTIGKGEALTAGALVFRNARKRVPLRNVVVKAKRTPLVAKVGGSQLKVASTPKRTALKRTGFGSTFAARALELTAKAATRLSKKLRPQEPFEAGQGIGTLQSAAQPRVATILTESPGATLIPDPAFLTKLDSLFVSLNPISPAELRPGPYFQLPVSRGSQVAPDASAGTLRLGGAIEALQLGAGQVFHSEYWLEFEAGAASAEVEVLPAPAFPGKLGRIGVFGLDLAQASVSSDPKTRTISVTSAPLSLTEQTARTFNEAFAAGMPLFAAGEKFGAVSFGAVAQ